MSGLVDVLAAWDEDDEYPHRMTFVVLHPDTPLPAEAEVEAFFCPSFWVAPPEVLDLAGFRRVYLGE